MSAQPVEYSMSDLGTPSSGDKGRRLRAVPASPTIIPAAAPDALAKAATGYTVEDVLSLPPNTPRVELVDGDLLVVPSPTIEHQQTASMLWQWLHKRRPIHLEVVQAVGVAVSLHQTYEPDVVVYRPGLTTARHYLTADQVVLAVEVVSPNTRSRDRYDKPAGYAAAGIPFYWRIEQDPLTVYAYRLIFVDGEPSGYELMTDSATLLEVAEPFDIKLPITDITP